MDLATLVRPDVSPVLDVRYAPVPAAADDPPPAPAGATALATEAARHDRLAEADDHLDTVQDLGDEIAILAAHIHAAEHRFLTLIAEFDRLRGWHPGGHRSCAHWLAFRTGIDLGAARERVRAARALTGLPEISASMAQGELSFAKVRALTRVATAASERDLLELARSCTAAQLERTVRAWRRFSRHDEAELERMRHRSRCLSVFPDEDGMYLVRGRLDPEVGAMLMRAIDAAGDALFRGATAEEIEPKQRRADAVGLLAERALAVGFGPKDVAEGSEDDGETERGNTTPISGTRAERYQVVLHVEVATLQSGTGPRDSEQGREGSEQEADRSKLESEGSEHEPVRSDLEDGTRVSAETSRRLSCDASVVRLTEAPYDSGQGVARVLDAGRKTRTIPPAIRRALETRDRGCRFPGCGLRFTDAHHVRHWADGGETKLENLILLCRFHHRLVHEEGYRVHVPNGGQSNCRDRRLYFLDPTMRLIPGVPPHAPPLSAEPMKALMQQPRLRGVEPNYSTSSVRYKREVDIPSHVFARAIEALEEADPDRMEVASDASVFPGHDTRSAVNW